MAELKSPRSTKSLVAEVEVRRAIEIAEGGASSEPESKEAPPPIDVPIETSNARTLSLLKAVRNASGEHEHQEARRMIGMFLAEIGE